MEAIEPAYGATTLLLIAAAAVAVLLFLIMKVKLHAFVALVLVSVLTALAAGIPVADVPDALTYGFADTIGAVALLVGFGVMIGRLLELTGGAQVLADTLDRATATFLDEDKSPSRRLGGIDNRGSHFYLALYWARKLAEQTDDAQLAQAFADLAKTLTEQERTIVDELIAVQGSPADIGGYYQPDAAKASAVMRPSKIFNEAVPDQIPDSLGTIGIALPRDQTIEFLQQIIGDGYPEPD